MGNKEDLKTREDVFHIMDAELNDEEKKEVMECEYVSDLHFSVGMYIRNRFFYEDEDLKDTVHNLFDDSEEMSDDGEMIRLRFGSPDIWWEPIAEGYKKYLKKTENREADLHTKGLSLHSDGEVLMSDER